MGLLDVFRRGLAGKTKKPQPRQLSLLIAGYGVEAKPGLPISVEHLEQGPLIFGPIGPADPKVGQGGAILMPGGAPTGVLERRPDPTAMPDPAMIFSSGQAGTTELHLMPGMESYEPFLTTFRIADRPPQWTVVTDDYEIRWPANFTLRATGDLSPHPLEFGLAQASDDIITLPGVFTSQAHAAFRDRLVVEFGLKMVNRGEVRGTVGPVVWFEYSGEHDGKAFGQRIYSIPIDDDSFYLLRAQGAELASMCEAADLIASSFLPRG